MKKYFYLFIAAMLATFSLGLTSCSNDDDDDNGGSGSGKTTLKVGNNNYTFNNIYWNIDDESSTSTQNYYQLEFATFNIYGNKYPSKFSMFYVGFRAPGSTNELPTGSFSDFDLSGSVDVSSSNGEGTYIEGYNQNSGNLVISKEGNQYTISIEPLYILSGEDETNLTTTVTSLNYTGSIPKAPRKSWDGD